MVRPEESAVLMVCETLERRGVRREVVCGTQRVPAVPQAFRGRVIHELWGEGRGGSGAGP